MSYDHIVIGAGIVGSCTALALAKRNKHVLLLEQFPLPHTRGSSHGQSRLIRTSYSEEYFAQMMGQAFELWKEIEEDSGLSIIKKTGVLCASEAPYHDLQAALANNRRYGEPECQLLDEKTMATKYPFIKYDMTKYQVFMDKTGGAIMAANALQAAQTLFKKSGGQIMDSTPVKDITPGKMVTVSTTKGQEFTTAYLVVCCGAWTGKLLEQNLSLRLPLQPQRVKVYYFREKEANTKTTSFLDFQSDVYGLPALEYPGCMKVCIHFGVDCDPDRREQVPKTNESEAILFEYISEHLPGLETTPALVETCMYTMTPDEAFIIDRHPKHNNIIIGAGFSGTGFKLAPVTGSLLADLATGVEPSYDLKPFHISRFKNER